MSQAPGAEHQTHLIKVMTAGNLGNGQASGTSREGRLGTVAGCSCVVAKDDKGSEAMGITQDCFKSKK